MSLSFCSCVKSLAAVTWETCIRVLVRPNAFTCWKIRHDPAGRRCCESRLFAACFALPEGSCRALRQTPLTCVGQAFLIRSERERISAQPQEKWTNESDWTEDAAAMDLKRNASKTARKSRALPTVVR